MGWTNENEKHFGLVCATHDRELGRKNLMTAGMSIEETILFEHYLKETADLLEYPDFPEWLKSPERYKDVVRAHQEPTEDSIELLSLSSGTYNALRRNGIETIDELECMSTNELLRIRTIGETKVREIKEKLAKREREQTSLQ